MADIESQIYKVSRGETMGLSRVGDKFEVYPIMDFMDGTFLVYAPEDDVKIMEGCFFIAKKDENEDGILVRDMNSIGKYNNYKNIWTYERNVSIMNSLNLIPINWRIDKARKLLESRGYKVSKS